MAGVLMDSAVAPSMTATPISAAITEATRPTVAAIASPVVIAPPAALADIAVLKAEVTRERAPALLEGSAAAAKRAAIPHAEGLAMVAAEVALTGAVPLTAGVATVAEADTNRTRAQNLVRKLVRQVSSHSDARRKG